VRDHLRLNRQVGPHLDRQALLAIGAVVSVRRRHRARIADRSSPVAQRRHPRQRVNSSGCRAPRPSADTLKRLADALAVTGDYLLEGVTDEAAKARFEDRELLEQFQEVQKLPDEDKALVKPFLGAFLFKRKVQGLSAR
jgi:hypothetical protein